MLESIRIGSMFVNRRTQGVFRVSDIVLAGSTSQVDQIEIEQVSDPKNRKSMSWEVFACLLRNSKDGLFPYVETHRVVLVDARGPWSVATYEGEPATGLTLEAATKIAFELEQEGFKTDIAVDPIK